MLELVLAVHSYPVIAYLETVQEDKQSWEMGQYDKSGVKLWPR